MQSNDAVLEAIVLEGRCERCEKGLGIFAYLMGRSICAKCAQKQQAQQITPAHFTR